MSVLCHTLSFQKKLLYYIHFEIIIDPCNLTSSQHYNFFRIKVSFAQSEFYQALSIWQNMKWTAPRKHPTIIHWHIWSLNFISRTFSDGMWVGFHNRNYDQSEKSKICPEDHLWLSLSWNKKMFPISVRWKTSKVTYRFHNHCHDNPDSKCIYGFCLWMKSVNISHGWNKFVRYKDS